MAFDPSTASLVEAKPSTGEFDPSTATPIEAASAPVEGSGGAAFGVYPKPGMKPNDELSRSAKNIGRSAIEATPGAAAGLAGFAGGMEVGAAVGALTSPVLTPAAIPVLGFTGGLIGAFGASSAVTALGDKAHKVLFPEDWAARQAEKEAHPYEAFAGQTLANLAGMSPKTIVGGAQNMSKLGRMAASDPGQRVISAGLQTGIEAGSEFATEGKVDPVKLNVAAVTGIAFPNLNRVGQIPFAAGQKLGGKLAGMLPDGTKPVSPDVTGNTDRGDLPPKSTEATTPEERAVLIQSLKKRLAEKNATVPVTEAAFRNKETGEIQRVGKAHDEQQKIDLADTHDQGFVDERGNFLTRKEAAERVGTSGQVPVETYTAKELVSPSKTAESITAEIEALSQRLADAERSDATNVASETRAQIKTLQQKNSNLKLLEKLLSKKFLI